MNSRVVTGYRYIISTWMDDIVGRKTYRTCAAADDLVEGQGWWNAIGAASTRADGLLLATLLGLN